MMTFHAAEVQRLDVMVRIGEASAPNWLWQSGIIVAVFCSAQCFLAASCQPKPWVLALGGISYPLYLIHQNAGYILINVATPGVGKWGAVALARPVSLA
jgi:peptidoglycan/LPS O-acetylase OafA/YrhL